MEKSRFQSEFLNFSLTRSPLPLNVILRINSLLFFNCKRDNIIILFFSFLLGEKECKFSYLFIYLFSEIFKSWVGPIGINVSSTAFRISLRRIFRYR